MPAEIATSNYDQRTNASVISKQLDAPTNRPQMVRPTQALCTDRRQSAGAYEPQMANVEPRRSTAECTADQQETGVEENKLENNETKRGVRPQSILRNGMRTSLSRDYASVDSLARRVACE